MYWYIASDVSQYSNILFNTKWNQNMLLLREINGGFFFEKNYVPFRLTTMYNKSLKQAMIRWYITICDISIRFDFMYQCRLKTIRCTIYWYIVASLHSSSFLKHEYATLIAIIPCLEAKLYYYTFLKWRSDVLSV